MWADFWEPIVILRIGLWSFLLKHSANLHALLGAIEVQAGIIWGGCSSACGIVYQHVGWIAGWDATEVSPWALTSVDKPRTVMKFPPSILLREVWGSSISYVSVTANWNQGGGAPSGDLSRNADCLLSSANSPSEGPWGRDAHVTVGSLSVLSLKVCCSHKEHSRAWRADRWKR